jgi:dTDP-4-amino-4,6-dideoxygalactose transaminase
MSIKLNQPLQPNLTKLTKYLSQVNDSGWYTNFGPLHQELTERLEAYLGVKNLLLVSNGTLAIQVACKTLNVNSAITTPFSFVATTSALLWQGVDTAFSDIDLKTYNLCPEKLNESLSKDSHYDAIVATHVYGNPCNVDGLSSIAEKYNKKLVYDAAHAFGVKINNKSVLSYGDASTLSFHATKVFHSVEGGAIVFKSKTDYESAKQLINFGLKPDGTLGEPGINAKLNEYQCAVALTLLDDIEQVIENRVALFNLYRSELKDIVAMPIWHEDSSLNGAYFSIFITDLIKQKKIIKALSEKQIESRCYFTPSLDIAYPKQFSFGCSNSQEIAGGVLCLPLHNYMSHQDVVTIVNIIKKEI